MNRTYLNYLKILKDSDTFFTKILIFNLKIHLKSGCRIFICIHSASKSDYIFILICALNNFWTYSMFLDKNFLETWNWVFTCPVPSGCVIVWGWHPQTSRCCWCCWGTLRWTDAETDYWWGMWWTAAASSPHCSYWEC